MDSAPRFCGCAGLERLPELLRRKRPEPGAAQIALVEVRDVAALGDRALRSSRSSGRDMRRNATEGDHCREGNVERTRGRIGRSATAHVSEQHGGGDFRRGSHGHGRRSHGGDGPDVWRGLHSREREAGPFGEGAGDLDGSRRGASGVGAELEGEVGREERRRSGGGRSRNNSGRHDWVQSGACGCDGKAHMGLDHRRGERLNSVGSQLDWVVEEQPRRRSEFSRELRGLREQPTLLTSVGDSDKRHAPRLDQCPPATNSAMCGTEAVEVVARAWGSASEAMRWEAIARGTQDISLAALEFAAAGARRLDEALHAAVSDLRRPLEAMREDGAKLGEAERMRREQLRDGHRGKEHMARGRHAPVPLRRPQGEQPTQKGSFDSAPGPQALESLVSPRPEPNRLVHTQSWYASAGLTAY